MRRTSPGIALRLVGDVRCQGKTATTGWLPNINQVERFVQYKLQRHDAARMWRFCSASAASVALPPPLAQAPRAIRRRPNVLGHSLISTSTSDALEKSVSGFVPRGRCSYSAPPSTGSAAQYLAD
jgi:hypothetical protein